MHPEAVIFVLGSLGPILFGISVLVATHLVLGPRDPLRADLLRTLLTVLGWSLIGAGVAASLLFVIGLIWFLLPFIALLLLVEILVKRRAAHQRALLWIMATSAERLIPLVPAIEAFGRERGGLFGHGARRLAGMLAAGVPLPMALRRWRGLIPPGALPIILVGYQSGALAPALRQAASGEDPRGQLWVSLAGKLLYLCALLVFGAYIFIGMMIYIVPAYADIFADFEVELPAMTQSLIDVSGWLVQHWYLLVPILLPLFGATLLLMLYGVLCYVGWIRWDLPGTGWLLRRLDTAVILDALSLATKHGRPLPEAVGTLADSYPKATIRRRLRAVSRDLAGGADWCESLLARRLIKRPDAAIFRAAQRVGNLSWALAEMADSNRRRLAYRLHALIQVLFPPVIIAVGLAVMFFVVAMFIPLVSLIQSMTS